jgi:hypothetical protein
MSISDSTNQGTNPQEPQVSFRLLTLVTPTSLEETPLSNQQKPKTPNYHFGPHRNIDLPPHNHITKPNEPALLIHLDKNSKATV